MASFFHENSLSHPVRTLAFRPLAAGPHGSSRPPVHCSGLHRRGGSGPGHASIPGLLHAAVSGASRRSSRAPCADAASTLTAVPGFDPQEMVARFRQRAEAVRTRGMPPIEGPERQRFRQQAQQDFADFAMIGDAETELEDGILTLRIDLRPKDPGGDSGGAADQG